jgi:insulysin
MASNPNDVPHDQEVGRDASIPLLSDDVGMGRGMDEISRRRRIRSLWVFLVLLAGVLTYLIYSSVAIVHDATSASYGWEDITKPTNDPKIYKYLDEVLPNGPPIVMVQDAGAQLTGFAIGVSAGFYYDPMDFPGLAHFTEHMLFLGTSKYPKPTDFDEYLSSHGGMSNAFTDSEKTVYYNAIDTDALSEGLSRFVEFFSQPTFNSTYIEKEVNAVDSEHAMHMNDVHWRMFSLIATLTLPPVNHYSTGDSSTLLKEIASGDTTPSNSTTSNSTLVVSALEEAVRKYYSANYCFNRLSVAIVSPLAISDQLELVRAAFSGMTSPPLAQNCKSATNFTKASPELTASNGFPIPIWNRQKFIYSEAPAGVAPQVWIVFPYRSIESNGLGAKHPFGILETVLTYNGPNSFKQYVLSSGLATSVSFMYDDTSAGSIIYVAFSLSEGSIEKVPTLVDLTFSYLAKFRSIGGVTSQFVESLASIKKSVFNAGGSTRSTSPMSLAKFFASQMSSIDKSLTNPADLITSGEMILDIDPVIVNQILDIMVPNNSLVVVHDPKYTSAIPHWVSESVTESTEPELTNDNYDYKYRVFEISNSTADAWAASVAAVNITVLSNITVVPPMGNQIVVKPRNPNEPNISEDNSTMIPGVIAPRVNVTRIFSGPVQILAGNGTEVWYKDLELGRGTGKFWLWATLRPAASATFGVSPEEMQFNGELLTDILNVGLRSVLADYVLAGYEFAVSWMFAGYFEIRVSGWIGGVNGTQKAEMMVATILKEIRKPTLTYFDLVLSEKTNALSRTESVSDIAADAMNSLTVGSATTGDVLGYVNTYSPITRSSLVGWLNTTFANVYTTVYMSAASEYLTESGAGRFGELFRSVLGPSNIANPKAAVYFLAGPRYVKPVEVRMANPVADDPNSALLYSLTYGSDMSARDRILAALLSSILSPLVFRFIRTENQMGYIASCRTGVYPGPAGAVQLRVYIQGNQATPDMMEARLEQLFISQVPQMLANISLTDVADRAAGLAASLQETPNTAPIEASMFWSEIQDEAPCFLRTVNQAKYLESTDAGTLKQGIIDVFNAFVTTRRSLATVKIWQSEDGNNVANVGTWNATEIISTVNDTAVSGFLTVEKANTMFIPSVTKTVRELVFRRALNTTDPLWQPTIPSCDI